ncbi:MAG TPA: molybdopterin cofactor-binding domain-containing protein, partial [Blastocatellia bacterium]|nr:molybdopterin cofactor-binding domain-containing protein [Blastocatellia bacterium]
MKEIVPENGISRRSFLKTSSVSTAALIIGIASPWDLKASIQQDRTPKSVNPFPAWIRIEENGHVTLMAPRPDMGEGTLTSLPMIVAEELEVEWSTVTVEPAPVNQSVYGKQSLGGSGSITGSWQLLRQVGASARVMLIAGAAAQWNVDKDSCYAEKANVIHRPTGRKIAYGELIKKDLSSYVPLLASVPLKKSEDFKIIGKPTHKVELPAKVTGKAAFGIDVTVPGMLYAVVARCPAFGGKLVTFDATKAKAIPGVREVFAIDPVPPHTVGGIAVVADSTWQAIKGREALSIEWDSGPNGKDSSESIHAQFVSLAQKEGKVLRNDGNAPSVIDSAAKKIEATYELPFQAHATMEPLNCTAHVQPDKVEIWAATQAPDYGAGQVARIAGVPFNPQSIVFHPQLIGGGFGRRYQMDFVIEATQVSKAVGKPVKLTWTREDDMQHDFYRPASYHHMSASIDGSGRVNAWRHRVLSTSIRQYFNQSIPTPEAQEMDGAINVPYTIDNIRVEYACPQTGVPRAWWRSV